MERPKIKVKPTLLDKVIGYFSPGRANKRIFERYKYNAAGQLGYLTPGSPKKSMKGVIANPQSPDRDIAPKLNGQRGISRDLYYNSALASGAVRTRRTNVVGWGLRPKPILDHEFLGITRDEARSWEKNVKRRFMTWANSRFCDHTGRMNFWELQQLAFLSSTLNGDAFMMLPWQMPARAGNWPFELRVKLIEADLVRNPPEEFESIHGQHLSEKNVVSGIEYSKTNKLVAAYFANNYTDGLGVYGDFNTKFERIPIRSRSGRQNWHQIGEFERINQRRPVPFLAPVVDMIKTETRLTDSEITAALVASTFTVFIKDMSGLGSAINEGYTPEETIGGGGTTVDQDTGIQSNGLKDQGSELDYELGAGMIHMLDDKKEITIADPKRPNDSFAPFMDSIITQTCAGLEMSSEQVMKKFQSSYTAARAAFVESARRFLATQKTFAGQMPQPVWDAFLEHEVLKGHINAPGFLDDPVIREAWSNVRWIGPGRGQVDPLKETKASALKIASRQSDRHTEYVKEHGEDWEDSAEISSREEDTLRKLNLSVGLEPTELTGPDGIEEPEEGKK